MPYRPLLGLFCILIATGTAASYVISIAATYLDLGPVYGDVYYETVVMLITFIVFGKYLAARAKGRKVAMVGHGINDVPALT